MEKSTWQRVAQVLVDAFDIDVRRFQASVLEGMSHTSTGHSFRRWAQANPALFEVLVRGLSASAMATGRGMRDKGMAAELLARQLEAMPYEFRRAFTPSPQPQYVDRPSPQIPAELDQVEFKPHSSTLSETLEYLESQRMQGEFLGSLTREACRRLQPEALSGLREQMVQGKAELERSQFSAESPLTRSQKKDIVDSIFPNILRVFEEAEYVEIPEDATQQFFSLDRIESHVDHPVSRAGKKQFLASFALGLNAPESFAPKLDHFEDTALLIRSIVRAALASEEAKASLDAFARDIASTKLVWIRERRPKQWLEAIDIAAQELERRVS